MKRWFNTWQTLPQGMRKIITVDAAFKGKYTSDYVAVQCWGVKSPNYYLVDQLHSRQNVLGTCEMILEMKRRHPDAVGVYVEDKANGPAVLQILKREISSMVAWPEKGSGMTGMDKISRAESVSAVFEAGNVHVPDPEEVGWVNGYITEMLRFPFDKHDDRVDATTMALLILHRARHSRYLDAIKKMSRGI